MKTKLLPVLLFINIMVSAAGQEHLDKIIHVWGNMLWQQSLIVVDQDGNIYMTGIFEDTIYFDNKEKYLVNVDSMDFFIVKLYPDGSVAWTKVISGIGAEQARDIEVDADGYIYLSGKFDNSIVIDTLFIDVGWEMVWFLCKLDPDGNLVNFRSGKKDNENLKFFGMEFDKNGKIWLAGNTLTNHAFGFPLKSEGESDDGSTDFLARLNKDFEADTIFAYSDYAGTPCTNGCYYCSILTSDHNKNIYVSGHFNGGSFLSKSDQDGNILWIDTETFKDNSPDEIFVDKDDNLFIRCSDWILKFNEDGEELWNIDLSTRIWAYVVDRNGYSVLVYFQDWGTLEGLLIIDPEGEIVYDHPMEDIEFDQLLVDDNGNVYCNGTFIDEVILDDQVLHPGDGDNYVFGRLKVAEMISSIRTARLLQKKICNIYPNPMDKLLTIEKTDPGQYFIEITSLNGRLLCCTKAEEQLLQIDLSPFQPGVYLIKVKSGDYLQTEKIIKLE